jgi:hypothetical protein
MEKAKSDSKFHKTPEHFPSLPHQVGREGAEFDPFKGGEHRGSGEGWASSLPNPSQAKKGE